LFWKEQFLLTCGIGHDSVFVEDDDDFSFPASERAFEQSSAVAGIFAKTSAIPANRKPSVLIKRYARGLWAFI
jgi:hypothetical protein